MISIRQIEAFRAIMTTGSATQAASLLEVSQPAVSRLIFDLEDAIGFKLFVRRNRQMQPTPEGRSFYDEVLRAFVGLDHISRAAVEIRSGNTGHLRLIVIPALVNSIAAKVIADYHKRWPDVMISLEVEPSHRILEWITTQSADIGLATLPFDSPAVTAIKMARSSAVCLLHRDHPLAAKEVICPADLAGLPFISFKADTVFRHHVDEAFARAGVERRLMIEIRATEAAFALVGEGLGVTVVQGDFYAYQKFPNVVRRPFRPSLEVDLVAFHNPRVTLSSNARNFLELMQRSIGEKYREG